MINSRFINRAGYSSDRLLFCVATIAYVTTFNLVYQTIGAKYYSGWCPWYFPYASVSFKWFIFYSMVALWPASWLPYRINKPIDLFLWVYYLLYFIPQCYLAMYWSASWKTDFFFNILVTAASFYIIYKLVTYFEKYKFKLQPLRINAYIIWGVIFLFVILSLVFLVIKLYSIMHFAVSFIEIHKQRILFKQAILPRSIWGYLFGLLNGVMFPFFIVIGTYNRRWLLFIFGAFGQILLYCMAGMKTTLLAIIVLPILVFGFKYFSRRISFSLVVYISVTIIIFVASIYWFYGNDTLFELFYRRPLVGANITNLWHWSFFDSHPHVYLSYTFLNPFGHYPYAKGIPEEVCMYILNNAKSTCSANAGYLSGAYANFGAIGMLIYSFILAIVLFVFNDVLRYWSKYIGYTLMLWVGYNFISTDLFTSLLTHGVLLWIFLLYLLAPSKNK